MTAPSRVTRSALFLSVGVALVGCAELPNIPIAVGERRVVSLDGRAGMICGTFNSGEAFCAGSEVRFPFAELNARHTGRAIQMEHSDTTMCALFESGDVWCDDRAQGPGFVGRKNGVAYHEIAIGNGFGCAVDTDQQVTCWGSVESSDVEPSPFVIEGSNIRAPATKRWWFDRTFRIPRVSEARGVRVTNDQVCVMSSAELRCLAYTNNRSNDEFGEMPRSNTCGLLGGDDELDGGCATSSPFGGDFGSDFGSDLPSMTPPRPIYANGTIAFATEVDAHRYDAFGAIAAFMCGVDGDHHVSCMGTPPDALRLRAFKPSEIDNTTTVASDLEGAATLELSQTHGCVVSSSSGPRADPRSIIAETNRAEPESGELWCWGLGERGQLGNAINARSSLPVRTQGLHDVRAVGLGFDDTCAIAGDGALYCWGAIDRLPEVEAPLDDPCKDKKSLCVPHRVTGFHAGDRPPR